MDEETICLQCGNRGFENAFVYCIRCLSFAVHRYCLDVVPETFDEIVHWLCDDCKVKVQEQSDVPEHDATLDKARHHEVAKNCPLFVEASKHACKDGSEQAYDACVKIDLAECEGSASQHIPVQLDAKNDENASHFPEDASKTSQQSSSLLWLEKEKIDSNLVESIELPDSCPNQKKRQVKRKKRRTRWQNKRRRPKQKRDILESTNEKNQHRLDTETYNEPVRAVINKCTRSASEPTELSAGCLEQKKVKFEDKRKRNRNIMERAAEEDQHILAATSHIENVEVDTNKCTVTEMNDVLSDGCLEQRKVETDYKRKLRKRNIETPTTEENQHRLAAAPHIENVKVDTNKSTVTEMINELSDGCLEKRKMATDYKRKLRKRDNKIPTTEEDQHRLGATSYNVHAEVDINEYTRPVSETIELSACCLEQKKTVTENKRKSKRQKNIMGPAAEKDQNRLAATSYNEHVKVDIDCTRSMSEPIELSAGCLEEKKTEMENKRMTRKRKINITTSYHEHVKENIRDLILTSKMKEVESSEQKDQTCISTPFGSITDLVIAGVPADDSVVSINEPSKNLKGNTRITSSDPILQKQVHRTSVAQAPENIDSHLENEFADLSNKERDLGLCYNSIENRGPEDEEEPTSTITQSRKSCNHYPKDFSYSKDLSFCVAEPVALPIWRGSFNIWNKKYSNVEDLIAHISNKACHKVYKAACQFQQVLHLEMLPKSDIWPRSFLTAEPSGDSIALYFFASKIREQAFEKLVDEMIHKELAFKACVQNVDLLIFTSTELPLRYWRFHNKYYLWGVFREKQSAPLDSLSTGGVTGIPLIRKRCDDGALAVH